MTERNITVRLRMAVRDYVQGGNEAEVSTRRLAAAQRDMAAAARDAGAELDRAAKASERHGRMAGRGAMYAAAGVAALGAAGGGVKALPPLLAAAGATAGALPTVFGGAAAQAIVLKVALGGVGDAAKEVLKTEDPFARLAPSARALVAEVKRVQPAVAAFRREVQQRALRGTAADLNLLATRTLPQVSESAYALADDWSAAFREMTLAASDPVVVQSVNQLGRSTDRFFDQVIARIQPVSRALATLMTAGDPVARVIGDRIAAALDKFVAATERAKASGDLDEFFRAGAESAAAMAQIAGDVLTITGQVIGAVSKHNGSVRQAGDSLAAYVASGRSAADVAGIVDTLTAAYEGLRDVLGPLGSIVRDALADPGTAQAVATMFDVLAAGSQALRVVFDLFQLLPDSMQATVLAGLALIAVGRKLVTSIALVEVAAGKAATRLTAMGAAGAVAGRGMTGLVGALGKVATALVVLQLAGMVLDQFDGAAPNVADLATSLEKYAAQGKLSGEITRLFGDNLSGMEQAARGASDGWIPKLGRGIEELLPPTKSLNEMIHGGSFTGDVERFQALDAALADYAKTTNDTITVQKLWNEAYLASGLTAEEFAKLLPVSAAELERLQNAAHSGGTAMQAQSERAKVLGGSFREAALAGKDLATTMDMINGKNISAIQGQIALEAAYDAASESIDTNGRAVRKGTHEIDMSTEAGRANMQALIGISAAAKTAAQAEVDRTGKTEAGTAILNTARARFITLASSMTGSAAAARRLADEIFGIPSKDVKVGAETAEAKRRVEEMGFTVKRLPDGKLVIVKANNDQAKKKFKEAQRLLDAVNSKTVTITVRTVQVGGKGQARGEADESQQKVRQAAGGINIPRPRAAADGLVQPQIRPPGTLYQWAEPETGGEAFLPRRGISRERGRSILDTASAWYGGRFVPMAGGGVTAAGGLVNVEPADAVVSPVRATRLDVIEAIIRARDAIVSLNAALKENGRQFSTATAKGRANVSALLASVRAAQEAARTKFEETGSVAKANAVYDAHIAQLRKTLAQQKINAKTIAALIKQYAMRPAYDVPAAKPKIPANSLANVAFAKAAVAAASGIDELKDKLSLSKPAVGLDTPEGRENLMAIIQFLETAGTAAQARFEQTKNASTATALYNTYVAQLRAALGGAGYAPALINSLINAYGKITLTPNLRGGVYMAAAGGVVLRDPKLYAPGDRPMYGWAEPGTGGELFLPRHGDRQRGRDLLAVGAGWYGGRFVSGGAAGDTHTTINNNLTVHSRRDALTMAELEGFMRQLDAQARVGRRR